MTRLEELILILWNQKGEMPEQIADELCIPKDMVEDVVENISNYQEVDMFPKDKLFWALVRECRRMTGQKYITEGERHTYLVGYKWGWLDCQYQI